MTYIVHEHGRGRKRSQGWELSLTGDEWRATSAHSCKVDALTAAETCLHHAVVTCKNDGTMVFDNEKPPRDRTDWD